jgi:hypothetical protein
VRNNMKSPYIGQRQFAGVPSASPSSESLSKRSLLWVVPALTALMLLMSVVQAAAWSRPASEQGPTRVIAAVFIVDVDEIDSAGQKFTANVYIEYRWRDESLVHPGPGTIVKDLTDVWHPQIQIINQQRVLKTFPDVVTVFPNGEVIYRQRVWGNFSQALNLQDFPFDRQVFNIRLAAVQHSPEQVDSSPLLISLTEWQRKYLWRTGRLWVGTLKFSHTNRSLPGERWPASGFRSRPSDE